MPKNKKLINLLPQVQFDASTTGRILRWAMGSFRYIVIITEMVVMGAFLSRFWLDAQNSDLSDSIKTKSAVIASQATFEKQFRDLQNKVNIFKSLDSENKKTGIINKIAQKIPSGIIIQTLNIQDDLIQIKALAGSEISIAQFISNTKADKTFKNVELGQTSTQENNQFLISFSVNIKY